MIPFFLIRFTLLSKLDKAAIKRAAHYPSSKENEVIAPKVYQLATIAIVIGPLFLTIKIEDTWSFYFSFVIYLLGLVTCVISIVNFASPSKNGLNRNGIYKFSRNPMYVSYFLIFMGCSLLTKSWILLSMVLVFQTSAHWIILSEERWCVETFGNSYRQYKNDVRRYI